MITHSQIGRSLLNLVMPHECIRCGHPDEWLCQTCVHTLSYLTQQHCPECRRPSPDGETHGQCLSDTYLDGVIVATQKQPTLQRAIHVFKYHNARDLAQVFAHIMTQSVERLPLAATRFLNSETALVPLPLHKRKQWDRGYNHAGLIAHAFAHNWPLIVREDVLIRTRNTKPQAQLSRSARLTNLVDAFAADPNVGPLPESAVIIDDVMTTGATIKDAARALKFAGVRTVWGLVLVRE